MSKKIVNPKPLLNWKIFLENSASALGRQIMIGLVGLVTTVLIARACGPEGIGQYGLIIILPNLLALAVNMGLSAACIYVLSSGAAKLKSVVSASCLIISGLSIVGLLAGSVIITIWSDILFPNISVEILWLSIFMFPIMLVNGVLISCFTGLQRFSIFNKLLSIEPALFLLSLFISFLVQSVDLWTLISCKFGANFISLIITAIAIKGKMGSDKIVHKNTKDTTKLLLNFGFKANLGPILQFLNYKSDVIFLNIFTGAAPAGIYMVAVFLAEKIFLLSGAVGLVLFPTLSEMEPNAIARKHLTPLICQAVFGLSAAVAIFMVVFSYPLIEVFFGDVYLESQTALLILCPAAAVLSAAKILANDIAARGKPELNVYTSSLGLIVNVIGNLILIPKFGMVGAAMTTLGSYLCMSIMTLAIYVRLSGNSYLTTFLIQKRDLIKFLRSIKLRIWRKL